MTAFHDVRFPTAISLGASGGPERRTRIVALASGFEERQSAWADSRRRWEAGMGVRSLDDLHAVTAFFEARRGRLHGFRWKDASDWRSGLPSAAPTPLDQRIGTGDGTATAFDLVKTYESGGHEWARRIDKPVAGSVRCAVGGIETAATVEGARVIFATPPPDGAVVTAGFDFDVPVRFDTDRLEVSLTAFEAGEIPSIPVIELRLTR